jgi:plasmid maintenance system antidote protein VapI
MEIDDQQAAIRDLIRLMMEKTGLDPTGLARSAGVAPSTLTRFLNQPVKHLLTARTLAKLSKVSGVPVPVGSPLTTGSEQELLDAYRSSDQQGREMIMRLARSVRRTPPSETGNDPPAATNRPRAVGCGVPVVPLPRRR